MHKVTTVLSTNIRPAILILGIIFFTALGLLANPLSASAVTVPVCAKGQVSTPQKPCDSKPPEPCTDAAAQLESRCDSELAANKKAKIYDESGLVKKYIVPTINLLAALVGIVVTISIVYGGIQYSTSADDPSKVSAAKKRIFNALLALLGFLFLYAFLQWLVPGGFLNE